MSTHNQRYHEASSKDAQGDEEVLKSEPDEETDDLDGKQDVGFGRDRATVRRLSRLTRRLLRGASGPASQLTAALTRIHWVYSSAFFCPSKSCGGQSTGVSSVARQVPFTRSNGPASP